MNNHKLVAGHYTRGDLLKAICAGVERMGKSPETVDIEDLAPVDEFHIGGRQATRTFLDQIAITADDHVIDVGCGIGGSSRFAALTYGCRVTGIDLTKEFVDAGNTLCSWVGSNKQVELVQGDALDLSFPDATFDKAFMLHVGMNIANKAALAKEVGRVLKPGGIFGIYDIMQTSSEPIVFPVPWASIAEASSLASSDDYKDVVIAAGFELVNERNQREFALEFFERLKAAAMVAEGPPPLGLHILMGKNAPAKVQNMIENIAMNRVAPIELIFRKV
jgi:SAM-dependent methyltransferase